MNIEIFKDIPNYEGVYQVSNLGNVKSLKFGKEKLLSITTGKSGYNKVNFSICNIKKTINIHTLVAITFLNHKQDGYKKIIDHINNIKTDNRLENLQITTVRHNNSKDVKNKTSLFTGVSWSKHKKKWAAYIFYDKKLHFLGYFKNEIDAKSKYDNHLKSISYV